MQNRKNKSNVYYDRRLHTLPYLFAYTGTVNTKTMQKMIEDFEKHHTDKTT